MGPILAPPAASSYYLGVGRQLGQCTISDNQRMLHVSAEAIAVLIAAPFSFWLAARPELPGWARALSAVIGAGTLAVDGYLVVSYLRNKP